MAQPKTPSTEGGTGRSPCTPILLPRPLDLYVQASNTLRFRAYNVSFQSHCDMRTLGLGTAEALGLSPCEPFAQEGGGTVRTAEISVVTPTQHDLSDGF